MQPAEHGNGPGREKRDISARAALAFGVILAIGTVASLFFIKWTFDRFADRETAAQSAPASLVRGEQTRLLPPEPRLQMNPVDDLEAMRAEENAVLHSYGWEDEEAGIARIPVDDAVEMLLERGLPAHPAVAGGER